MAESKIVTWVCDKCDTRNTREIGMKEIINDDTCNFCHKVIHEPLVIALATKSDKKKRKKK